MTLSQTRTTAQKIKRAMRLAIDKVPYLNRTLLASAGYRVISRQRALDLAARAGSSSWSRAARTQERIYRRLVEDVHAGAPRLDIRIAADSVIATGLQNPRLLEVGCGNGYYNEILAALVPGGVRYTGADYSTAMVESARIRYPAQTFLQADTTALDMADNSFDIVMDGVSVMHILEYRKAIAEIARVASKFAILNSVPVFETGETGYLTKYAYGSPVTEIVFGRKELEDLIVQSGLEIVDALPGLPYDVFHVAGRHSGCLTYLARKR